MIPLNNPADTVILITPSNSVNLPEMVRAIRATAGGNIRMITARGDDVTCAFGAGETRPIRANKIFATGTTATGIEGMI